MITPRLPKRPLIWSDAVYDLQALLQNENLAAPHAVYLVGGAVRDAYLHRPIHDIDLVTNDNAIQLARKIANAAGGDLFVMDAERDVARVLLPDHHAEIDIAAMRGNDLLSDLNERDFTLNAMAVDLLGDLDALIDPLNGEQDILNKYLRRCSPNAIANDVIRALRAVRQSLQLGFRIEPETLNDLRRYAPHITETSPERVRDECFKLLALPNTASALRVGQHLGLIAAIVPEVTALSPADWDETLRVIDRLNALLAAISFQRTDNTAATFEMGSVVMVMDRYRAPLNDFFLNTAWANNRPHRALILLAGLLHKIDTQRDYAEELRLSNAEKVRLSAMLNHYQHAVFEQDVTPLAAHRYWHRLGEAGLDVMLLSMASYLATRQQLVNQDDWILRMERIGLLLEAYFVRHDEIVAPPPFLDGNDLKDFFQLRPSPIIGELLTYLREAQVQGQVTDQAQAVVAAREYIERQNDRD